MRAFEAFGVAAVWFSRAPRGTKFLRSVLRRGATLSTLRPGYFLTVSVLTRLSAVSIIRSSSFAPLFGPSLRRALTFPGSVSPRGVAPRERWRRERMHRKESDVLLPVNAARCINFVYTASRQGECYGK